MKYNPYMDAKDNNVYGFRKSMSKFPIKARNTQQVSLTQSLFTSKKNSLKNILSTNQKQKQNNGFIDFYQTLNTGFGNQWIRPQSKHASRRQSNRPQTSKGPRSYMTGQAGGLRNFGKQKYSNSNQLIIKNAFPSKSMYNSSAQYPFEEISQKQKNNQNMSRKQKIQEPDGDQFYEPNKNSKNVRIVVTRNDKPRKQKSFYSDKFQTNLPDDFLSLFAN